MSTRRAIMGGATPLLTLFLGFLASPWHPAFGQDKPATAPRKPATKPLLRMSEAVVCDTINGYEDYVPLPGAALTSDEKLLIYYRPSNYRVSLEKGSYQAHLTQDAQVRKRGAKKIIWQKPKLLDYTTPKQDLPPTQIYLRNTIALKGLEPGDYDLIIILHDENNEGRTATQVVKFRVVPAMDVPKKEKAKETPPEESSKSPE